MRTVQIGMWEFHFEPGRLTYRLTLAGLIPGSLLMALLALFAGIWCSQTYRAGNYLGSAVLVLVTLGCLYGLIHHWRGWFRPYTLDKASNSFSNGFKDRCALSNITGVEVTEVKGVRGSDGITRYSYHVDYRLRNGETTSSYIVSSTQSQSEKYAEQLQRFFDENSL